MIFKFLIVYFGWKMGKKGCTFWFVSVFELAALLERSYLKRYVSSDLLT